jgi:hypothetical protein
MSTDILRELCERFKGRLSNCRLYDANVGAFRAAPERPWELIPVSGAPFSRKLRSRYRGRELSMFANDTYLNGTINGEFASRPFSVNAKLRAGFRSEYAADARINGAQYPIFSETGRLSPDQESLLDRPEGRSLIEGSNLREGESLYFTKGEMGFYLKQPTAERASLVVDRMVDLAALLEIPQKTLDLNLLPAQFHPLIPLVQKWAAADDSDRSDLLDITEPLVLRALINEVDPYRSAIDSYLDSFRAGHPTEEAAALGRLAEFAVEAGRRLSSA